MARSIAEIEHSTVRKVSKRLIPFLFLCFAISILDRLNISFAALQMNETLNFSNEVYGLGAGYRLFSVGSTGRCFDDEVRREKMDFPHHDFLGYHLRSHGIRYDSSAVLCCSLCTRCSGSLLLPVHGVVS